MVWYAPWGGTPFTKGADGSGTAKSKEEEDAHETPGWLPAEARTSLIRAIAQDERERHDLCVRLQAIARGVACRAWMQERVAIWLQQKEMEKMEAAIQFARTNGAATTLQRVARGSVFAVWGLGL